LASRGAASIHELLNSLQPDQELRHVVARGQFALAISDTGYVLAARRDASIRCVNHV